MLDLFLLCFLVYLWIQSTWCINLTSSSFRAYRHGRRMRHQKCVQVACERERTECALYIFLSQLGHIFNPVDISNSSFISICSKLWVDSFYLFPITQPDQSLGVLILKIVAREKILIITANKKKLQSNILIILCLTVSDVSCLWLLKFFTCSDFYLRNFSIAFLPSVHPSFLPHPFFGMTLTKLTTGWKIGQPRSRTCWRCD